MFDRCILCVDPVAAGQVTNRAASELPQVFAAGAVIEDGPVRVSRLFHVREPWHAQDAARLADSIGGILVNPSEPSGPIFAGVQVFVFTFNFAGRDDGTKAPNSLVRQAGVVTTCDGRGTLYSLTQCASGDPTLGTWAGFIAGIKKTLFPPLMCENVSPEAFDSAVEWCRGVGTLAVMDNAPGAVV